MPYELKLEKFSGPLEKLLELIEERKLEIAEVSLAQVTDDFLRYLKTLTDAKTDLRLVSDFIAVASRLILIKSKSLIPDFSLTGEEEAEIKDLERRLKLYQELKPAMKVLARLWRGRSKSFSRPYFLARGFAPASPKLQRGEPSVAGSGIFYPGQKLDVAALYESLNKILESLQVFELETQTIREKIISIEEKMEEIVKRLQSEAESSFTNLSSAKSRSEIIIIFLAILHLAREQLIFLEQADHFSEIIIKKRSEKSLPRRQAGESQPNVPNLNS